MSVPPGSVTAPLMEALVELPNVSVECSVPTAAPAFRPNCGTTFNRRKRPRNTSPLLGPFGPRSEYDDATVIDFSRITTFFVTAPGADDADASATQATSAHSPLTRRTCSVALAASPSAGRTDSGVRVTQLLFRTVKSAHRLSQ